MAQGLIPRYTFPVPRHIDDARTVAEVNRFEVMWFASFKAIRAHLAENL